MIVYRREIKKKKVRRKYVTLRFRREKKDSERGRGSDWKMGMWRKDCVLEGNSITNGLIERCVIETRKVHLKLLSVTDMDNIVKLYVDQGITISVVKRCIVHCITNLTPQLFRLTRIDEYLVNRNEPLE